MRPFHDWATSAAYSNRWQVKEFLGVPAALRDAVAPTFGARCIKKGIKQHTDGMYLF